MKSQDFNVPVKGLKNVFKNTYFTFDANGVYVSVSVNIHPKTAKFLSSSNIVKGEKMLVYRLRKHVPSKFITANTVQKVHDYLLNNCMINVRNAKIKSINKEVKVLKTKQLKLNF